MSIESEVLKHRKGFKSPYDPEIDQEAKELIAHGALTNSKRPESFVKGVYPTHLKSSQGCHVIDLKGNRYIDFICALGTNLLGYGHQQVGEAIKRALEKGTSFSLGTLSEVNLAKKIRTLFPFIERMRFLKTGSEACSAAIRMARTYTRKRGVIVEGYHGWHEPFASLNSDDVSDRFQICRMADDMFLPSDTAAIMIEPVITDSSPKRVSEIQEIRDYCTRNNIVLIFDETITGLRFPGLSVASHFGIEPDIIVFGKALAGGLPLSCIGGKKEILESDYFVSSTFAGEILALEAAQAVLSLLDHSHDAYRIDRLWQEGQSFLRRFNEIEPALIRIEGYPTRGVFQAKDDLTQALFFQEACQAGILFGPSFFLSFAHLLGGVLNSVLSSANDILKRISRQEVQLKGQLPVKPFA